MLRQKIKIRHRLLTKLQVSHLIVVVIPIVLAAWFLVGIAQKSLERTIQNRNLEFARRAAQLITTTLDYAQAIVRITAQNPLIYESNRITQELTINNLVKRFQIFKQVYLLDASGAVSISTSYRQEKIDFSNRLFINQLLSGQSYYSDVYLSEDTHPVIDIAEPIRYRNEVIGALFVNVDLQMTWDLVENWRLGEKGQAFIIDRNGAYLAHSERKQVYLKKQFDQSDILQDIQGGISNQKVYQNDVGIVMLASYTPLKKQEELHLRANEPFSTDIFSSTYSPSSLIQKQSLSSFSMISLEKLGLGVVIQQPISEAFAPARKMRYQTVIFAMVSITLALILASINTRRILLPIAKLIAGIERFSTGNLEYKIEPIGKDEIGMLSERFNEMAVRLLEYQNKLKRTERLELMNKMSSVLSHEIRNPLNSMVINMQIMRREFQRKNINREKLEKYHEIVASEIKRVDELVKNFLLVARPPKLNKNKIAIDALLNEVIIMQQATALSKGVRVERQFKVNDLYMLIDEARIQQVFLNIYLNGIQAVKGGGKLTIKLSVLNRNNGILPDKDNKVACIQFIDTGKGMPPEVMKHIFDFYFSTKEGGTGLGLSIAQQIVEEHGGKLIVESTVNVGSVFSIYLPIYN